MELLEAVPDPRGARGKRYPLPALLAWAVVALLAGMTSDEAVVDPGKQRGGEFLRLLGFTRRRGLCKATSSRVSRCLDVADFEARVAQGIPGRLGAEDAPHLALAGSPVNANLKMNQPCSPALILGLPLSARWTSIRVRRDPARPGPDKDVGPLECPKDDRPLVSPKRTLTSPLRRVWLAIAPLALTIGPGCGIAPKSFRALADPAPIVRARAAGLGTKLPDTVVIPALIDRLGDTDPVVRLSASEELRKRTGQDFGYLPWGDLVERQRTIDRWRAWWQARKVALARSSRKS